MVKIFWGSLKIFIKIFEDPYEDLNKDPQKFLPRSLRILKDPWGSSIFLPRSLRIFKDLWRSFADLTKILPRSLRIFKVLRWPFADLIKMFEDLQGSFTDLTKVLRILNFLAKIFEDHQRSLKILCGSCEDLWGPLSTSLPKI